MRLGDLDALLINAEPYRCGHGGYSRMVDVWHIEHAPTIDAVPVVRCRYCRSHHWEQEPCHGKTVHYCKKLNAEVTADFFCAAGKRKDGDGNG